MKSKIIIFFLLGGLIFAQKGSLKGKIIDAKTKQPLAGANVLLMNTEFGGATNEEGYYEIKNIPENVYKLKINFLGYNTHIEPDIRIIRNKTFAVKEITLIESPIYSDEVMVTSGYFNDKKDMPVSNYEYTKDEIIRAPGAAGDLFRAIETLPGVSSSGGEFSAFSVRGGAPKDNLILIDNIPFSNVSHFVESSGNDEVQGGRFSIFTAGLVEKANFQGGGFSAKYGGKKASFLDIQLKEGNKESFTLNGTYDLFGWEANYDGPAYILKNTSIVASARSQDLKTVLEMIDQIDSGHPKFSDYLIKITSDISKSHKLSFLSLYSTESSIRELEHLYKSKNFDDRSLRNETEDKYLTGLNWRFLTSEKSFLTTSLYYAYTDQIQKEGRAYPDMINGVRPTKENVFVRNPIGIYDSKENQYGFKSDFSLSLSKTFTLNIGTLLQHIYKTSSIAMNGEDTLYTFNSSEIASSSPKYLIIEPDEIENNFKKGRTEVSFYGEGALNIFDKLTINAGFRYDYDDISHKDYFSPRLSGSFQFTPVTSINFATGIYYQLPEMLTLSAEADNSKLKSEKTIHFITGISHYLSENLKLTAEVYYKDLRDLVVKPNSNNAKAFNSGKGYSYGLDFGLLHRFVNNIYGQINYSYGVCKIKDDDKSEYYDYDFNQTHIFNILAGYQLNDNWSFSLKWKYATGRPKDNYIIHSNVLNSNKMIRYSREITSTNSRRFGDYHSLNFRVDYRKQFGNYLAIVAFLDILNLYGRENELNEIFIETAGKNKSETLGMLPSIGLKLEI